MSRLRSYMASLKALGVPGFIKYVFLKRIDRDHAKIFYTTSVIRRRRCFPRDLFFDYWFSGRDLYVSFGYGEYHVLTYVSEKDYRSIMLYFPHSMVEVFCEKVYDHDREFSGYDTLIDVGSTVGEFIAYSLVKGFRRERIFSVEPFSFITVRRRGRAVNTHFKTLITDPGTFRNLIDLSVGRTLLKIDCEGCEKHLSIEDLTSLGKGSTAVIEYHPWTMDKMREDFNRCAKLFGRALVKRVDKDVWLLFIFI
jgi:hypothetical protein